MGTPTGSRFGHWYWPLVYSAEAFFKTETLRIIYPSERTKAFSVVTTLIRWLQHSKHFSMFTSL